MWQEKNAKGLASKVYFNILNIEETKEMIAILSVATYNSLTTGFQIWVNKEFHEDICF